MIDKEVWKDVDGYEGLYKVSNLGRVKRLQRKLEKSNGVKQTFVEMILKPQKTPEGYLVVGLSDISNRRKTYKIHRLVAKAFVKNLLNKPEVDHIDANKNNNRADNLRWVTRKEQYTNPITYARVANRFCHSDYEDLYMFNSF